MGWGSENRKETPVRIELSHVSLARQGTPILRDVNLTVEDGTFVSVLGASGAGKSTLLGVICGLVEQTAGSVAFDGRAVDALAAHRRDVTVVFQDARLFPHLSVLENVMFPLKMRGVSRARRRERAEDLLEAVQLAGFGGRGVHELSGGQRQRVALARALAPRPGAVLLDEPFSGLDESLRDAMRHLVVALHERVGTTMVMVTHDPVEALTMSHRVLYLAGGCVVEEGTPEMLLRSTNPLVGASFGAVAAVEGTVDGAQFVRGRLRVEAPGMPDGAAVLLRRSDASMRIVPATAEGEKR